MPGTMIVHDRRLRGRTPAIAPNTFHVSENTDLRGALNWIATYATQQGNLDNLFVFAHGFEAGVEDNIEMVSTYALGYGLQFCREGLDLYNVATTQVLNNKVRRITLFSCGPANTRRGFERTRGDGGQFCSEMAGWTNASVIAAIETQLYNIRTSIWDRLLGREGEMDFGDWEGPVYEFTPDSNHRRIK